MLVRKRIAAFLFVLAPLLADQVDDIVKAEMARQHIPGVAIAVMKDGLVIRSAGYGTANLELNVAVTPRTAFKIGSISKQFLASGIMILAQEGKLRVTDKVSQYLPDAPSAWRGVTLRHLMSHTGGLTREGPGFDPLKEQPDIQVIRSAYVLPLVFEPGAAWQYSNIGFFTLAEIVSRVAAKPWADFLDERIFGPLQMTATRTTTWREIVPNRADGYVWQNGAQFNAPEFRAVRPSGAFLSTVEDLAKWDAALETDAPLKKATREQMWTAVTLNDGKASGYGYGWEVQTRAGKRSVHHGGSLPGFRAHFARFPSERFSVVVLTNGDQVKPEQILWQLAAVWLPGVDQEPPNGRAK